MKPLSIGLMGGSAAVGTLVGVGTASSEAKLHAPKPQDVARSTLFAGVFGGIGFSAAAMIDSGSPSGLTKGIVRGSGVFGGVVAAGVGAALLTHSVYSKPGSES